MRAGATLVLCVQQGSQIAWVHLFISIPPKVHREVKAALRVQLLAREIACFIDGIDGIEVVILHDEWSAAFDPYAVPVAKFG
jgi:hypothetical protein